MSIFKKSDSAPNPRTTTSSTGRSAGTDGTLSIIGTGMVVIGDLATEGTVRIEGEVQGTVRAGKAVVLGQKGLIEGSIITEDAVIGGSVRGTVVATNRIELQSTCSVMGTLRTRPEHLKLDEGARFTGEVQVLESDQPLPALGPGQTSIGDDAEGEHGPVETDYAIDAGARTS